MSNSLYGMKHSLLKSFAQPKTFLIVEFNGLIEFYFCVDMIY